MKLTIAIVALATLSAASPLMGLELSGRPHVMTCTALAIAQTAKDSSLRELLINYTQFTSW